ncbi:hypothetical protein GKS15_00785 [Streptococcus uberis]|nr:hypothetical protein [Streptococcus uberis]
MNLALFGIKMLYYIVAHIFLKLINWSDFFTWILTISVSSVFYYLLSYRRIKVIGITIKQINKSIKQPISFILRDCKEYQNGVENELVVSNPRNEQFLHKIEINFLEINDYKYNEDKFQVFFNYRSQEIYIVQINNGSQLSKQYEIKVQIFSKDLDLYLINKNVNTKSISSGEICILERISLDTLSLGKNITIFQKLTIKIKSINSDNLLSILYLRYDYLENDYKLAGSLGAGSPQSNREAIPVLLLNDRYDTGPYHFTLNKILNNGINLLKWIVLVDFPVKIKYEVILKNIDGKILYKYIVKSTKIKFPKYKFNDPFNREFENILLNMDSDIITYDEIVERNKEENLHLPINNINWNYNIYID